MAPLFLREGTKWERENRLSERDSLSQVAVWICESNVNIDQEQIATWNSIGNKIAIVNK